MRKNLGRVVRTPLSVYKCEQMKWSGWSYPASYNCREFHDSSSKETRSSFPDSAQIAFNKLISKLQEVPQRVSNLPENFRIRVTNFMESYEEFIGIKQVKEAHSRVLQVIF